MKGGSMHCGEDETPVATALDRKCMLVLGMHRSGTSALTRILNFLGAQLPKDLLPAHPSNERGHWEPQRLVELHDVILAEVGSQWSNWRPFDLTMLGKDRLAHYQAKIARIISEEYGNATVFVVKDPRICRLMPLWRSVLAGLGVDAKCAIAFRHPLEVAWSLERRDGFPLVHGCLLWLRYMLQVELETRDLPRLLISYRELLSNPVGIARQIAAQLGGNALVAKQGTKSRIKSFIDPELCHHTAQPEQLNDREAFYPWLKDTYEAHAILARSPTDKQAQRILDHVSEDFDSAAGFLGALADEVESLREQERTLRETTTRQDAALAKYERKLASHKAQIHALVTSASWRITAPLRVAKKTLAEPKSLCEKGDPPTDT